MTVRPSPWMLIVAAGCLCVLARADGGSERFDAHVAEPLPAQRAEIARPAAGRSRFLACGYVAPGLDAAEAVESGDDRAFARMLERLRDRLLSLGAAP